MVSCSFCSGVHDFWSSFRKSKMSFSTDLAVNLGCLKKSQNIYATWLGLGFSGWWWNTRGKGNCREGGHHRISNQEAGKGVWHQLFDGCCHFSTSREIQWTLTHLRHDFALFLNAARDIAHQRCIQSLSLHLLLRKLIFTSCIQRNQAHLSKISRRLTFQNIICTCVDVSMQG